MKNILKFFEKCIEINGTWWYYNSNERKEVKIMDKLEKLYTPEEVADILKFSKKTVQNYISNGNIKSVKVFGANRVRESDLLDLIRERR